MASTSATSRRARAMSKARLNCISCDGPTGRPWEDYLDGRIALCDACQPHVDQPSVHLFGAPDGQELARWSDFIPQPEAPMEVIGVAFREEWNPWR